ncbi:MAG: prolyl oligopeptidase family serine peptidase [Prevotella sp.]|jgi:predicted peptidase|nr:prolyl oligopeptidase family serine peptidase [Prevotella sp.]MCH4018600.1 prolyl oligopeptidase family serine peptidase [Prevotella sp.]MCI1349568.1 prolyl oligopeptidase family serine peptidase [Prevotella sp.]MCI2124936.1 prolyl oligopeptidase family serine peptidase [Prevotella sp.]
MKKTILLLLLTIVSLSSSAYDFLRPVKGQIPGGYNFWVYTPQDYYYSLERTPVIIFLHGASLCGHNLNKVRRYGPLDAIVKGRDIEAITIVPQNPGGAWNPKKVMQVLDWVKSNYQCDSTRVYVLGMSLGGFGTMDVCGTYPDRIAAGIALCGGTSLKDVSGLGKLPFWIIHGTADRAVPIRQSKEVVEKLQDSHNDSRLRYEWLEGGNHGTPARIFYLKKTYEWLFSHSLVDKGRPVNRDINIGMSDIQKAYSDIHSGTDNPEIIDGPSITTGHEY